ncbi:ABC transporter ATP-binding protein [Labrys wisconsinensis]|uniref:Spermidine/putrescine import ATP-binding protein PotA n=1 Tax=Labrys wisconsinensis TaxID=425677 RepID=A0ABU0JHD2_9HYPH|nr:ABC transporter ATP-binding protein [Labrys wisconsinensis]MDQ0472891.1 spermidine/putrescine transport system ATP-binding protein [Labrys wisconsinensis]
MSRDIILRLAGVSKAYRQVQVLEPVDLAIRDGEFIAILGPSGSGKTTILRMIGGFTAPSSGQILFEGRDIVGEPTFERPFNTVFQDYALFPHMRVAENVGYGLRVRGRPKAEIARRVAEVLSIVELADKAHRYPGELSGGQRQRVALARAIVCEPKIVLLDEPLAALDAGLRRAMQDFLKELQRRIHTTFLFVTHDQQEAIAMADRIVVMNHGRIEQVGTPEEIYLRPASEFVARFFGDNNVIPAVVGSRADGHRQVESAVGRVAIAADEPVAEGARIHLVVRPEHIEIAPLPAARPQDVVARVRSVTFLGAVSQVVLEAGEPQAFALRASMPTASLPALSVGETVAARWDLRRASLLERDVLTS